MNGVINSDKFTDRFGRSAFSLDEDWRFLKLKQKDGLAFIKAESAEFDDSAWERIDPPHT